MRIPDLFRGSQVTLIGRYSNDADLKAIQMKLTGKAGGTSRAYTYPNLSFPLRAETNDYLPRLWATRRVGWLMEQVRTNGEQKELRDEIIDLGTRYGIVTPYTSYLALEDGQVSQRFVTSGGQPGQAVTRRPAKAGTGGVSAPNAAPPAPSPGRATADSSLSVVTGAEAVQQSKRAREQQDVLRVKEEEKSDAVRRVAGKAFYLIDGVWTDSEFKAESRLPETVIAFGSEEYFALLKQIPKLGSFFSLGERVVVVFEGRVYRVNAPTP